MAASQSKLNRAKILRLATTNIASAPLDASNGPTYKMSPQTPTGLTTTGLALGLKAPNASPATAVAAGFSVVVWVINPVTLAWFSNSTAVIPFGQLFVTFDFNASGLYFQVLAASVAVDGNIDFHLWEQ